MRKICMLIFFVCASFGADKTAPQKQEPNPERILECNAIFEARKAEIKDTLIHLNERMQNLEVYKNATQNLLNQRESKLKEQEQILESKIKQFKTQQELAIQQIQQEKQDIQNLIAKNEQLLKEIKTASSDKMAKAFSGMKDSKAAPIIAELDDIKAAEILSSLSASEMAKILAKMDAKRAAQLTKIITKGPPFIQDDVTESQDSKETQEDSHIESNQNQLQNNDAI